MSSGQIVQIIGAVIDVEFSRESVPKVYDALKVTSTGLTLEVQQQLGDGVVRSIAMGECIAKRPLGCNEGHHTDRLAVAGCLIVFELLGQSK